MVELNRIGGAANIGRMNSAAESSPLAGLVKAGKALGGRIVAFFRGLTGSGGGQAVGERRGADDPSLAGHYRARLEGQYGRRIGRMAWAAAAGSPENKTLADRVTHARVAGKALSNLAQTKNHHAAKLLGMRTVLAFNKKARADGGSGRLQPLSLHQEKAMLGDIERRVRSHPDFGKRILPQSEVHDIVKAAFSAALREQRGTG